MDGAAIVLYNGDDAVAKVEAEVEDSLTKLMKVGELLTKGQSIRLQLQAFSNGSIPPYLTLIRPHRITCRVGHILFLDLTCSVNGYSGTTAPTDRQKSQRYPLPPSHV